MKRILSLWVMIVLLLSLTACGLNGEGKVISTLHLKNQLDDSVIDIKVDSDRAYIADGAALAFRCELSAEELQASLAELNPNSTFKALDDHQVMMMSRPYTLFSKNVVSPDGEPVENVCVVVNESIVADKNNAKLCFPFHLAEDSFIFGEDDGIYTLDVVLSDPFCDSIVLKSTPTIFTDLAGFYQDCDYGIHYIGGNTTGGSISVFSNDADLSGNPIPLYQILVMADDSGRFAMQYGEGMDIRGTKAEEFVGRYVGALNNKDKDAFLGCYDGIDENAVDSFLDSIKSCTLNDCEIFWADQSTQEYILQVDLTLTSEEGKQMGSYGTGEVNRTEYWLIKPNGGVDGGEIEIHCQTDCFDDAVSKLTIYKEFEDRRGEVEPEESKKPVDWLFTLTPAE